MKQTAPRFFSAAAGAIVLALLVPHPAQAQGGDLEARVKRLESEVRAVQRKVFPGGSERFFEPEVQPETAPETAQPSNTNSAVADLLLRVDALESQLAALTAIGEENSFKLGQMEERLAALEVKAEAEEVIEAAPGAEEAVAAAAEEPSPERIAAVSAIIKPESDDAGEDDYIYGFRLWDAGFYSEAQQQLALTVEKHPEHRRISHARNLLGRAYLDGGKPGRAAQILLENYQKGPRGARAADSLYYLGRSLIASGDNAKACASFAEMADVYPDIAEGRLSDELASGRQDADCD
ncbi:MAG: tetratricopeptide repeat protein [Pseudomonadota bacterium]